VCHPLIAGRRLHFSYAAIAGKSVDTPSMELRDLQVGSLGTVNVLEIAKRTGARV